jgi:hypothetical protein
MQRIDDPFVLLLIGLMLLELVAMAVFMPRPERAPSPTGSTSTR